MTGTRARPWLPAINDAERDTRAAIIDPRPEPGLRQTLRDGVAQQPGLAWAARIIAALLVALTVWECL